MSADGESPRGTGRGTDPGVELHERSAPADERPALGRSELRALTEPYARPSPARAWAQVITAFLAFGALWSAACLALEISYALTLAAAVLAAGFQVRIFIIQHDCGHGAFSATPGVNHVLGSLCGVLTFTPYFYWRRQHWFHHGAVGNLDRRGIGDVDLLTVAEYLAASWPARAWYRFLRHPLGLLLVVPSLLFVLAHRVPLHLPRRFRKERASVHLTNLALFAVFGALAWTLGARRVLLVQAPITLVATAAGVWLFFVQHQFPGTYWARGERWSWVAAGLQGSSWYRLPKLLQWFTGNIGMHHLHHLNPRIPNYLLERCLDETPILRKRPLTLRESLGCARLALWDEERGTLVPFAALRERQHEEARGSRDCPESPQ